MSRFNLIAAALSIDLATSQSCLASYALDTTCYWSKQKQYANFSVAGATDEAAACCDACEADDRCMQWALQTGDATKIKDLCILNEAQVKGTAPQDDSFGCIGAKKPETPCRAGCLSNPGPPAKAPAGAKNVLFFAVDDLRPDFDVFGGCPGTPTPTMHTPNIDALAAKSLVLRKNYCQQAVCSPTRQSMLTGRRPDRTRVYDLLVFFREVGGNYTTIPEWFRMNGYISIGMGKIFHPGKASGGNFGYSDDMCCSWSDNEFYFHAPNHEQWRGKDGYHEGRSWFAVDEQLEALHPLEDDQIADNAVDVLGDLANARAAGDDRPFFMAVGFHKPHLPFVASQRFFDLYPLSEIEMPGNDQPPLGMPSVAWSKSGELLGFVDQVIYNVSGDPGTNLPSQDVLELRRGYYASISQTDAMIGKVMAALEATGEADNTVVVFWGDHGWQLGEHGEWAKHTNFEFAARSPMMVHVPGLTDQGIIVDHYTEHVDLFPTLTEAAAGLSLQTCPEGDASFGVQLCTEGSSLVPLMLNPAWPVKTAAFSQYPRSYQKFGAGGILAGSADLGASMSPCIKSDGNGCTMGHTMVTMVDGHEYRYTEWADFNTPGHELHVDWNRIVGVELYNHSADPGENINVHVMDPSQAIEELSAQLSQTLRAGPSAARIQARQAFV